jgi:hypothetical protein
MALRLELRHSLNCGVCGATHDSDDSRSRAITVELFGVNWEGFIKEGNCPQCLRRASYSPARVRRLWLKKLRRTAEELRGEK